MSVDLRPCRSCGAPDVLPPAAFSETIDAAVQSRNLTDADLAAAARISAGYAWRLRQAHRITCRPSLTVARRIADALELDGEARRIVIESARVGVGLDVTGSE